MFIYDFVQKVAREMEQSQKEADRCDSMQAHGVAHGHRIRAATLHDVLTWAGFEDCEVVKTEVLTAKDRQIADLAEELRKAGEAYAELEDIARWTKVESVVAMEGVPDQAGNVWSREAIEKMVADWAPAKTRTTRLRAEERDGRLCAVVSETENRPVRPVTLGNGQTVDLSTRTGRVEAAWWLEEMEADAYMMKPAQRRAIDLAKSGQTMTDDEVDALAAMVERETAEVPRG